MASKVFFTNMRTTTEENLPQKLRRLVDRAGMGDIDFSGKFTAIKLHFGEPGNLAYLRPQYARALVEYIRERGGIPFLTDCNTLYVGGRTNAMDHIQTAYENGYTPYATGAQVIIADGVKGIDDAVVPIDGELVHEAKIGRALYDADIIISLTHAKGHEMAGFGGAIKNLGMGGGSRAGKFEMHSDGKPYVSKSRCVGCGICTRFCGQRAITIVDKKANIDSAKCAGCGRCIGVCPRHALNNGSDQSVDKLNKKMAEYAYAVLKGKPNFHVSIATDISPYCDCHSENDAPVVPNIGMFASFDPVAIDVACMDAINAQPVLPGSLLDEKEHSGKDYFADIHPITDWHVQTAHGEKLALGSQDYELITI